MKQEISIETRRSRKFRVQSIKWAGILLYLISIITLLIPSMPVWANLTGALFGAFLWIISMVRSAKLETISGN
jgi:hypothetical protein